VVYLSDSQICVVVHRKVPLLSLVTRGAISDKSLGISSEGTDVV